MVKIVKPAAAGPEIVTLQDLMRGPPVATATAQPAGALHQAQDAVNQMDKWISLADRGLGMLGKVDSIMSRVQAMQGRAPPAQRDQRGPAPDQGIVMMPPGERGPINADHAGQAPPGDPPATPAGRPQGVDIRQIIGALDMIAKSTPGITVEQLAESMKHQPEACQRVLDAARSGKLPGVPDGT
jgi:hypothetical protein